MRRQLRFAHLLAAVVLTGTTLPVFAQEAPGKPAELKVLDRLVGAWNVERISKPTEDNPKETRTAGTMTIAWVLDGWFLQARGISNSGKFEDLQFVTYDPRAKAYRHWYFNSLGVASDSTGQWDEAAQTILWTADLENGATLRNKEHFIDKDTTEWALVIKDKQGELLLDVQGKLTRRKPGEALPKEEKADPKRPRPAELKVLERYLGTWDFDMTNKPAAWTPKEERKANVATNEWVLGEMFLQGRGRTSDKVESVDLTTYDPQKKAYRTWYFDSRGYHSVWSGQWDEAAKTMTIRSDWDDGVTAQAQMRFIDPSSRELKLVAKDKEGKLLLDAQGEIRRRK